MAKTPETLRLEDSIYKSVIKQGVFGCFEVTIGWFGQERVDFMTYDTKQVWRCYEVKCSVQDFRSKAAITFVGHYNYYVLNQSTYDKVKAEIPDGIGVYVGGLCVKKAKRRVPGCDERILWESMVRSLSREYNLTRKSEDRARMQRLEAETNRAVRECRDARAEANALYGDIYETFGQKGIEAVRKRRREHNDG